MTFQKKYTHIFFDLDHTLWDFDANNRITFHEILSELGLYELGIPNLETFLRVYHDFNKELWGLYKEGKIEKSFLSVHRFELTLKHFRFVEPEETARRIAQLYIDRSPEKTILIDGSIEVLDYLKPRYRLGLITNGFNEIQYRKIALSGLEPYFEWVITSEEAGCKKPDPEIFRYALLKTSALPKQCLYVGDEPETDIPGAREAGIDQVLLCHNCFDIEFPATYTIHHLKELIHIL